MIRLVVIVIIALILITPVILISKEWQKQNEVNDKEVERKFKRTLEKLEKSKKDEK